MSRLKGKLFSSWGRAVQRRPRFFVVLVILVSVICASRIPHLEMDMDLQAFIPRSDTAATMDMVEQRFGESPPVMLVLVESTLPDGNVLSRDSMEEQWTLYQSLVQNDDIDSVVCLAGLLDEIGRNAPFGQYGGEGIVSMNSSEYQKLIGAAQYLLQNPDDLAIVAELPGFENVTIPSVESILALLPDDFSVNDMSADSTLFVIAFDGGLSPQHLEDATRWVADRLDVVHLTTIDASPTSGELLAYQLEENTTSDMLFLGLLAMSLVAALLLLTFRRISYVILPLATLFLGLIWTFGLWSMSGYPLTVLDMAAVPLIIGLGVDFSIYLSRDHLEMKREGHRDAMSRTVGRLGAVLGLTALTTMVAFSSNLAADMIPLQRFGMLCALGIFVTLMLTLTFHAAARSIIDDGRQYDRQIPVGEPWFLRWGIQRVYGTIRLYPVVILSITVVLATVSLMGAVTVERDFTEDDFLPSDWEALQTRDSIRSSYNMSQYSQIYVLKEGDDLENPQTLEELSQFTAALEDDTQVVRIGGKPYVTSPLTVISQALVRDPSLSFRYDFDPDTHLPLPNCTSQDVSGLLDIISEDDSILDPISGITMSQALSSVVYEDGDGYTSMLIRVYVRSSGTREYRTLRQEMEGNVGDMDLTISGYPLVMLETVESLTDSQFKTTGAALIFAGLLVVLMYGSIRLGLIVISPVILASVSILGTVAVMSVLGQALPSIPSISLNVLTISITALSVGLGVDYSIHITDRYLREVEDRSPPQALERTLRTTGSSLTISAMTTMLGFVVLTFSPIPALSQFGLVTTITIAYAFCFSILFLPVLLLIHSEVSAREGAE